MHETEPSSRSTKPPTKTREEWVSRYQEAAREQRDTTLCQACRLVAAKRKYPVTDRLNRVIGEEVRCDDCQRKYETDQSFRVRRNLRFRDRMRYLCWERLGSHTASYPDLNELITRLLASYGGMEGAVNHAYVLIHNPDTPVIWQRRILMALTNMIRLREEMEHAREVKRRNGKDIARWLAKVKPEEALEFLTPLMNELIDQRMDVIVEYLRGCGWTLIPPWTVEPLAADGVESRYEPPPGTPTIRRNAEPPLHFREST